MIVVSDTSPIANLIKIGHLDLLRLVYGTIFIPTQVYEEVQALQNFGYNVEDFSSLSWIHQVSPQNMVWVNELIHQDLDRGEAEAIVLAKELGANVLLMDERLGTSVARSMGLHTIGLLGILVVAKRQNIITDVKNWLDLLQNKGGFWVSPALKVHILNMVDEN